MDNNADNKAENNTEKHEDDVIRPAGIQAFVAHTTTIGHVILGTADKDAYEPLPFTDYSLFEENTDPNVLKIHINPLTTKRHIFLPKVPISVDITAERKQGPHYFHPYSYTITFKHGDYQWEVLRSFKEIKDAHKSLAKLVKMDLGQSCSDISKSNIRDDWPIFPTGHDHLIQDNQKDDRCKKLAEYLRRVLTYPPFRDHPAITTLLGVSYLSFTVDTGNSFIEGYLSKRTGDNIYYGNCSKLKICCDHVKIFHLKRWFCIKESYIAYLNPHKDNELCFLMLVDMDFTYKKGIRAGAFHSISISNLQRSLVLKCKNATQQLEWYENIEKMVQGEAHVFCNPQRFQSFAPIREKQTCKWYVNGASYMEAVLAGINAAKEEIYITDWWLCPEIYLKRPSEDLQYRLDRVLIKRAKEGVKVYVLLFKEVEFALKLQSLRAKRILTEAGKNPNIKVLRHPEHTPAGVFLWSHHEKCVVIDQSVAFMGGVDLCFGRWDDDLHRLVDLGRKENKTELSSSPILNLASPAPNIVREIEKMKVNKSNENIELDQMNTTNQQLMNASDALLVAALMGRFAANAKAKKGLKKEAAEPSHATNTENNSSIAVTEATDHISDLPSKSNDNMLPNDDNEEQTTSDVDRGSKKERVRQKWDRLKFTVKRKNEKIKRQMHIHSGSDSDEESMDEEDLRHDIAEIPVISYEGYYWVGKDYANTYKQDFKNVEEFGRDQFDRESTPRMPWRDEALVMYGEAARDVARHFIQRWNQCKREKVNKNALYPYLIPKAYKNGINYDFSWFKEPTYTCDIQITRSMDSWSGGISTIEHSILNAYQELINLAEHFIYIENQFFVTTTEPTSDPDVKNCIGQALVSRIKKAYSKQEKFRVYIVLPLLPGFDNQSAIQAVQYYNLRSINLDKYCIYNDLKRSGIEDPSVYITFHGMRNHAVLMNRLVQEIIYVHSKLMIVDDKYVICGSANINDRSLLGSRDSELAAVITDTEFTSSKFNGVKVQVGKYAHSLRTKIFKLHLGLYFENPNRIDVTDCTSDAFYQFFRDTSKKNTETYDNVFKCIPSDNILTFEDLINYSGRSSLNTQNPAQAKKVVDENIKGFIVDFPLNFLSKEANFLPTKRTIEGLVPTEMWT